MSEDFSEMSEIWRSRAEFFQNVWEDFEMNLWDFETCMKNSHAWRLSRGGCFKL